MPKNLIMLLIAAIAGASALAAEAPRRILWFGNSFTMQKDISRRFADLAELAGHPRPVIVTELSGGTTVAWHLEKALTNEEASVSHPAAGGDFTDVVIQGHSLDATSKRGVAVDAPGGFFESVENLYALVRSKPNGAKARCILYETWARHPSHKDYPKLFADADAMQSEITVNYAKAADRLAAKWGAQSVAVAPCGQAFRRLGYARDLYSTDCYHQGGIAAQLLAMQLFDTVYGESAAAKVDFASASAAKWTGTLCVHKDGKEHPYELTEHDWRRICSAVNHDKERRTPCGK